jgi:hypothetical protein
LPYLLTAPTPDEAARRWDTMIAAMAKHRVGQRPDRYEPRLVKRRKKMYRSLTMPRAKAKELLREGVKIDGEKVRLM